MEPARCLTTMCKHIITHSGRNTRTHTRTHTNTGLDVERGYLPLPHCTAPLINRTSSLQHLPNTQYPPFHALYNTGTHAEVQTLPSTGAQMNANAKIHIIDVHLVHTHWHTHTDLGVVWLEVSFLSTSPLFILTPLACAALIGCEAAGRVGLDVGLILQGSSDTKEKSHVVF